MKIVFYGSGDDNFCFEGDLSGEVGAYDRPEALRVIDENGLGCFVTAHYAPTKKGPGCWAIGVMPLDEDVPLPEGWTFSIGSEGYSTRLTVETPGSVYVQVWGEVDPESREDWVTAR